MLIYREAAEGGGGTEPGSAAVQRYRSAGDIEIPEMGEGRSPSSHLFFPSSLPIFLMLRGSSALLYGLFRELLQVFGGLLKVFILFSKNFWEAYPALTRRFSTLFKSE